MNPTCCARMAPRRFSATCRTRLRQCCAALLLGGTAALSFAAAPSPSVVPDTIAQRVLACTGCHGKEGVSTNQGYFPRIAGKPAGYLRNQLIGFRDGRRSNPTMRRFTATMSDAYLEEIATHFAALELPYPPPPARSESAQEVSHGESLVTRGDASRGIPACASCHGRALTGITPAVPGLLGLPKAYLLAQLGQWRSGQRRATAPDCMADIARRLNARDLSAAAAYLSLQPLPADPRPAARLPSPPAIVCGSSPW